MRAHKSEILRTRYEDAVAVTAAAQLADPLLLELPGPRPATLYPHAIANVAASRAEDFCVLDLQADQRLIAACVCAPSYWRPGGKIGLPLWQVHAPVHGMNAKIGGRVRYFIDNMPLNRPFERRNWFLHGDAERFHLLPEAALTVPPATWFVRSERQVLCRLSSRFMLFTIGVVCEPLADLEQFPLAAAALAAALVRMDADEVAHFGGVEKHRRLAEYVTQLV